MKKTTARLIIIAVSTLIIVNLVLIVLIWSKKEDERVARPKRTIEEVNDFMVKELELNASQATAFLEISKRHRVIQERNQEEFRRRKMELNSQMIRGKSLDFDSASARLAEVMISKEREFFRFFAEALTICDEEQKKKLQQVFTEAIGPPPSHGPRPKR